MTHFPSLTATQKALLAEHGIDAERSCSNMLAEIRAGTFAPKIKRTYRYTRCGIPAALVLEART